MEEKTDEQLREKAQERVRQRMNLLYGIGIWVVFSAFFFLVWLLTGSVGFHEGDEFKYPWFLWIIGAWGLAVMLQVVAYLFGRRGEASRGRMVEKEIQRMKNGR